MAKYCIHYESCSTGYGWTKETDHIKDVEGIIIDLGHEYSVFLSVWDDGLKGFIFWKDPLRFDAEINKVEDRGRDFRTMNRRKRTQNAEW